MTTGTCRRIKGGFSIITLRLLLAAGAGFEKKLFAFGNTYTGSRNMIPINMGPPLISSKY